ncbi:MAG: glycosyltransferase family 4 protein [Opitutales bacterium]
MKIAYLFTTFPRVSETFLQREVTLMAEQGIELRLYTLMGGSQRWRSFRVYRLNFWELFKVLWRLPKWVFLKPGTMLEAVERLQPRYDNSPLNIAETLYGYAFALVKAEHFEKRRRPDLIHCVWATMPATAGWLLSRLVGIPFSMGAHAYDVFKEGGDRLLDLKVREARLIHTTTLSCQRRLVEIGAHPDKVKVIRRGLDAFPRLKPLRKPRTCLRLIAVGRLVPKKGYGELLKILAHCQREGLDFQFRLIGGGSLADTLRRQREALGLRERVELVGRIEFGQVSEHYGWADVLLFTGKVAPDGDRDGLPNVIPEAMAWGLPVITSPVAGTTEAITHGETGLVAALDRPGDWLRHLRRLQSDDLLADALRQRARSWVEVNYDNQKNARRLAELLKGVAMKSDTGN